MASRTAKHVDMGASRTLEDTRYEGLVEREGLAADRTDTGTLSSKAGNTAKNVHSTKATLWGVYRGADALASRERGRTDRTYLGNAGTRRLGNNLFIVACSVALGMAPQEKSQTK
jgi:hypothetical protein